MRRTLVLGCAFVALCGCGSGKQVVVGEKGESGVVKRKIDTANGVAAKASQFQKSGESDAYGG